MCAQVAACLLHFWLHGLDVRYGPPCPQYGDVQYGLDAQYRSGVQCDTATRTPLICSLLRRDTHARTHARMHIHKYAHTDIYAHMHTHKHTRTHTISRTRTHRHVCRVGHSRVSAPYMTVHMVGLARTVYWPEPCTYD